MRRFPISILIVASLQFCTALAWSAGIGDAVAWRDIAGWRADHQAEAWPALLASCEKLDDQPAWRDACAAARDLAAPDDAQVRAFFEAHFRPHPMVGENGARSGLITGYYEPLLHGSFKPDERYRYPLYAPPDDLLTLDPGATQPESDRQQRGRRQDGRIVPYPSREVLTESPALLAGSELLWVDDAVDAFFLHVQGSGRVRLPDGRTVAVRFADHNGHPYRSIGRRLIQRGALARDAVNLFTIRTWLRQHPSEAQALLNHNPRFIFFRLDGFDSGSPRGALNVPLTPGRSLAVDRDLLPLGAPVWLSTSMPGEPGRPLRRLMLAQDTGSAIQGWNRADVFWGAGKEAERRAGLMKESGRLFVLLPR